MTALYFRAVFDMVERCLFARESSSDDCMTQWSLSSLSRSNIELRSLGWG
jgi:hypothetical protein